MQQEVKIKCNIADMQQKVRDSTYSSTLKCLEINSILIEQDFTVVTRLKKPVNVTASESPVFCLTLKIELEYGVDVIYLWERRRCEALSACPQRRNAWPDLFLSLCPAALPP